MVSLPGVKIATTLLPRAAIDADGAVRLVGVQDTTLWTQRIRLLESAENATTRQPKVATPHDVGAAASRALVPDTEHEHRLELRMGSWSAC
mmetsp:Transcript_10793/g.16956  ORF Transcript_10793/g.16956 Transcript_10793/m.16956 type:complete len:91 (-) Transcript_10793:1175-1447(-)